MHFLGVCSYGNRCNFLHAETEDDIVKQKTVQKRRMSVPSILTVSSNEFTNLPHSYYTSTTMDKYDNDYFQSSFASMNLSNNSSPFAEQSGRLPTFRRLSLSE